MAVRAATSSSILVTVDLNLPVTSSLASTALISLVRIFFLSSGMVIDMVAMLALMEAKSPSIVSVLFLRISCLFLRSAFAASRLNIFLTFLISSSAISNSFAIVSLFSASNEGILSFIKKLESLLSLLLSFIPSFFNPLDIGLKELWLLRVLKNNFTFVNKISDNSSLGIKLLKGLLLSFNQLINILNA